MKAPVMPAPTMTTSQRSDLVNRAAAKDRLSVSLHTERPVWSRFLGPSTIVAPLSISGFLLEAMAVHNEAQSKLRLQRTVWHLVPAGLSATKGRNIGPDAFFIDAAPNRNRSARNDPRCLELLPSPKKGKLMNKDRIHGAADQAKGAVEETTGKATGDTKLRAEGALDKTKGKVESAAGKAKDELDDDRE